MNLADVNILVGAIQPSNANHATCAGWLDFELNSGRPFAVSPLAVAAVIRITTNARIYEKPITLDDIFIYADALLNHPNCVAVEAGPRHWSVFRSLCMAAGATANLVTDAWYAALAIEHDCTFVTLGRDYRRFPGLRTAPPLIGP